MTEITSQGIQNAQVPEIPKSLDRLYDTIINAGESRVAQVVAGLQLPIYAAFVNSAMKEGMTWWGAIAHPVLNLSGGLDAMLGSTETANQMIFAATLGELKTVGIAALFTVGAATVDRMGKVTRGELPIVDPDGVVFLSAGFELPLADTVGRTVLGKMEVPGGPNNLYFSALYGLEKPRPVRPDSAFQKRHFISQADTKLNITDTNVLRPTGALTAKTVVLAAPNDRVLEDIAITIKQQQGDRVKIIPLPQNMTSFEAYSTISLETGKEQVLTEKPINPFRKLANLLAEISDPKKQNDVVAELTKGLPRNLREHRVNMILGKVKDLTGKKLSVFLDGSEGEEKLALIKSLSLEEVFDKFEIAESMEQASVIISFGEGNVTNDVSVSESSERIKEIIFQNESKALHIGLPFSTGNEDSVGAHALGVVSLQRLMAEEIAERIKDDLTKEKSIKEKLKGLLHGAVGKVAGAKIRQKVS